MTNKCLDNDNYIDYKMFNQAFQDLARVQSDMDSLVLQYKNKNEYDKLLNYRNEEAFINKDRLLDLLKKQVKSTKSSVSTYSTEVNISVDFTLTDGKGSNVCTIINMYKNKKDLIINNISQFKFIDMKEVYEYIKTYYDGINKIIVNMCGIGRSLADYINEDEDLKNKLIQNNYIDKMSRSQSITDFIWDAKLGKIIFKRSHGNPSFPIRINTEILLLFNEIQNLKLEYTENACISKLVNINVTKERGNILDCVLNYYVYLIREDKINNAKIEDRKLNKKSKF